VWLFQSRALIIRQIVDIGTQFLPGSGLAQFLGGFREQTGSLSSAMAKFARLACTCAKSAEASADPI